MFQIKKRVICLSLVLLICFTISSQVLSNNKITKEMDHFIYTYYRNNEPIDDINKILESNYNKILNKYGVNINRKINIEIFPSVDDFQKEYNLTNYSAGIVGTAVNTRKIGIVSPLNPGPVHSYDSILKIAVHEFVHVSTNIINTNIPIWLNEGISLFEAKQINPVHIKKLIKTDKIPSISELESNFYNNFGYAVSGTIVEYIVSDYSYERLVKLIKRPNDIQSVFGVKKSELSSNWKSFVIKKYE